LGLVGSSAQEGHRFAIDRFVELVGPRKRRAEVARELREMVKIYE
jgi:hypothetical protein